MTQTLVSIGMPVYNNASTLENAIQSLINQSYQNWELILINDGSTDLTEDILDKFLDSRIIRICDGKNLGLAKRLNQALMIANGKYFARMDADDLSFPERLEKQVEFLKAHPKIDLLGTGALVISDTNRLIGKFRLELSHEKICNNPWKGINIPHPTWMGKSEWFVANPYDESMRRGQDQLLLVSAHSFSCYACLPENLLAYRAGKTSLVNAIRNRAYYGLALFKFAAKKRNIVKGSAALARQIMIIGVELILRLFKANKLIDRQRFMEVDLQDQEHWTSLKTSLGLK